MKDVGPASCPPEEREKLIRVLSHPECPWEADRATVARRVQADRLFAFAFQCGCELMGIEPRCDELVASLGGRRELAWLGTRRLPVYVLPGAPPLDG